MVVLEWLGVVWLVCWLGLSWVLLVLVAVVAAVAELVVEWAEVAVGLAEVLVRLGLVMNPMSHCPLQYTVVNPAPAVQQSQVGAPS